MAHLAGGGRSGGLCRSEIGPVNVRKHLLAADATFIHLFERDAVFRRQCTLAIPPEADGLHRDAAFTSDLCRSASTLDSLSNVIHAPNSTVVDF